MPQIREWVGRRGVGSVGGLMMPSDTGTKRLFMATKLWYTAFDVEYTAIFRGVQCNSMALQQMPIWELQ